ncbi:MAG TPA: hypothetical protein VKB26_08925 [Candidatus Acidoferrales bacterium]|nr:hypothetical protein [Candidatus Acidoferrales bacterium]
MPQVKCPECGATAQLAMSTPYCTKCGWNHEGAVRRLRRFAWLLPSLIILFDGIGILGVGVKMHDWPGAILFATLPTLLLGFVYAGVRQGLSRLRSPAVAGAASEVNPASVADAAEASAAKERSEQYEFLISLPPPRPVQLSKRGKRLLMLLLAFALGMEGFLVWSFYGIWQRAGVVPNARGPEILLVCFMILVACLPLFVRRGMVRDKNLMENGAVAMGRVTEQKNVKNASLITYEFRDAEGRSVSGSGNDLTRSFFPEMTVPVFYDPQNSKRNVAACASFFEVTNPGV